MSPFRPEKQDKVATNTLQFEGRIFRILHVGNADKSYASAIVALDSHAADITELVATGVSLDAKYEMRPRDIFGGSYIFDTYEIVSDGDVVGYWDFPLLREPQVPDTRMLRIIGGLVAKAAEMLERDCENVLEAMADEILAAGESFEALDGIFGGSEVFGESDILDWVMEDGGEAYGLRIDTDNPRLSMSGVVLSHADKRPMIDDEGDRIRKNPKLEEYYRNPITKEELGAASCSRPAEYDTFAARLGRRMMKKGFKRGKGPDPARGLPQRIVDAEKKKLRTKVVRGFRRSKLPEEAAPKDVSSECQHSKSADTTRTRLSRRIVRKAAHESKNLQRCTQLSTYVYTLDTPMMPLGPPLHRRIRRGFGYAKYG